MQDYSGLTALMWAAQTGRTVSAKYLFDFEGLVSNDGRLASQYAEDSGKKNLAIYLRAKETGLESTDTLEGDLFEAAASDDV